MEGKTDSRTSGEMLLHAAESSVAGESVDTVSHVSAHGWPAVYCSVHGFRSA